MAKNRSAHRILFYLLSSVIIVTVMVLSQESPKDFTRLNIFHQAIEQNKELRQQAGKKYPDRIHSFTNSSLQLPLLLNEKTQMKQLNNVLNFQSNVYVVDTAIVQKTDGISRYTYTNNGKIIEELYQNWTNNQWVNISRFAYTYDTNGNKLSQSYEQWTNNQWVNIYRLTFTYDASGNQLSYLSENWTNNQWVNGKRFTSTYDASGNQLSFLEEYWTNNLWVNSYLASYTYDASGNQLSFLSKQWSNNQWVNDVRSTSTYDTNGNLISELYEYWAINQWVNNKRNTYTYDANRNRLSKLKEQWANNLWWNIDRYTSTYDVNENRLTYLYERWTNNQWVNNKRNTYTYDANRNQLSDIYEYWTNNQWVNGRRYTYKYFQNKLWSEGLLESWRDSLWSPDNGDFFLYDNAGNYYSYFGNKISLTYKLIVTNVSKDDGTIAKGYSLSQNYPNPFNPTTSIEYNLPKESYIKIVVSDVLGREIKTLVDEKKSVGSYKVQFDANDLSSGIYLYQLQTKEFSQTKKLLFMK